MSVLISDLRDKFEKWAIENGHNLTRHPNDNDFYFNRDVSMLWVCFSTGYVMGTEDQVASFTDELERLTPTAQEILIERALEDD
jgi:hypothetical protein